jgi:hypothetical protein
MLSNEIFQSSDNSVNACPGDAAELGKNPVKEADVVQRDLSELGQTHAVYACPGDAAELGKNPVKKDDVIQRDPPEL